MSGRSWLCVAVGMAILGLGTPSALAVDGSPEGSREETRIPQKAIGWSSSTDATKAKLPSEAIVLPDDRVSVGLPGGKTDVEVVEVVATGRCYKKGKEPKLPCYPCKRKDKRWPIDEIYPTSIAFGEAVYAILRFGNNERGVPSDMVVVPGSNAKVVAIGLERAPEPPQPTQSQQARYREDLAARCEADGGRLDGEPSYSTRWKDEVSIIVDLIISRVP